MCTEEHLGGGGGGGGGEQLKQYVQEALMQESLITYDFLHAVFKQTCFNIDF